MTGRASSATGSPSIPVGIAWRNALGITLVGCVVLGPCFVILPPALGHRADDIFSAGVELELAFALALGVILAGIWRWQKAEGSSLAALGWRQPTTKGALAGGLLLGLAWTGLSYFNFQRSLPGVDLRAISIVRVALVPVGLFMAAAEETMMRGFFMTQLHRGGVRPWLQIVASASCSALYHSLQFLGRPAAFVQSFAGSAVLFGAMAWLYVRGRRSLTPSILAHGLINVFGEPYLLMTLIALALKGAR